MTRAEFAKRVLVLPPEAPHREDPQREHADQPQRDHLERNGLRDERRERRDGVPFPLAAQPE